VVKQDKVIYSFLVHNDRRIGLDNDLCQFLLNEVNYDDKNLDAYSRKEKLQQQKDLQVGSGRPRRKITRLSIDLSGTQKLKKTRSESYKRFRLTPKHGLIAEVTLGNEADEAIVYPDLPQNSGALHAFLYRYNDDNSQLSSVALPINNNDWTCSGLRKRLRAIPLTIPTPVIINTYESKRFDIKLFEITTDNEQENMNYTGRYRLEIQMGFYLKRSNMNYLGEQTVTFEIEYDNGTDNDENVDADQMESPTLKE